MLTKGLSFWLRIVATEQKAILMGELCGKASVAMGKGLKSLEVHPQALSSGKSPSFSRLLQA
jgi:hypothetical protein